MRRKRHEKAHPRKKAHPRGKKHERAHRVTVPLSTKKVTENAKNSTTKYWGRRDIREHTLHEEESTAVAYFFFNCKNFSNECAFLFCSR